MVVHSAQVYIQLKPLFSRHNGIGVQFTDEPTGNLDRKNSNEVLRLLKEANEKFGQTLLIITHDMEVKKYATKCYSMEDGKLDQA